MDQKPRITSASPKRRYVLADNYTPRAQHKVELTESPKFVSRQLRKADATGVDAGSDPSLQNSIRMAMAKFE